MSWIVKSLHKNLEDLEEEIKGLLLEVENLKAERAVLVDVIQAELDRNRNHDLWYA
jgi:hypothetical protein